MKTFTINCLQCGKEIKSKYSARKFCGHNCRGKYYSGTNLHNYVEKEEIKCLNCGKQFIQRITQKRSFCSKKCSWEYTFIKNRGVIKHSFTSIEKEMSKFLLSKNKDFVCQCLMKTNLGKNRFIDFYIPKEKLFIECDGKHWHKEDSDRIRDKEILEVFPNHTIAHVVYGTPTIDWRYFRFDAQSSSLKEFKK